VISTFGGGMGLNVSLLLLQTASDGGGAFFRLASSIL
jgi:hypothetical protein